MERVVTINLNGNPYQLDEPAYDALRVYLSRAESALAANPDKAEILRDLEQAIAEKCAAFLSPTKTVISAAEMAKALEEMGPVDGASDAPEGDGAGAPGASPKKRLYRIRDNAQIAGVCAGIGAYFDLDVNIVRLIFIVAAIVTSGLFLLVYTVMMFIIPSAHTSEEWAAAHGVPFNAQEVIDRAKREYQHFTEHGPFWKWSGSQRRQWRREMRARLRGWRWWDSRGAYATQPIPPTVRPIGPVGAVIGGVFAIVFGIVQAIFTIVILYLLYMLITTGSIGAWRLPDDIRNWQATHVSDRIVMWPPIEAWPIIIVVLIVFSVTFRTLRWAAFGWRDPYHYYRGVEGLVSLIVLGVVAWFAWRHMPDVRQVMERIPDAIVQFGEFLRHAIN